MFTLSLLNMATHPESRNCPIDKSDPVLRDMKQVCVACGKRQASDWNYADLRGCHATAVG